MMTTLEEIQQAIRQLSRFQRESLAEWILNSADFGDRVAEPAAAYADLPEGRHLTVEEYLEMEESSSIKHEYVAGQIFAMSGPSLRHKVICDQLFRLFDRHLPGGPCAVFSSDVKVRLQVDRGEIFYYPDVVVACGPQAMDSHWFNNPRLIVEVLSPSTEVTDRREKALNYRRVDSIEEYVMVAQRPAQVTICRREREWVPEVLTDPAAVVHFRSIGLSVALEKIYEGTDNVGRSGLGTGQ